jgi:hypothetical protein
MAATRLIALHVNKGKTVAQCLADRTDYSQNAAKTDDGKYISSYHCDPKTADEEFLLSKRQYEYTTGRRQRKDVIAYQIRQSFKPGEITPEEANQVGYELAMRFTKGKHAFLVATHIDKAHIHNHIIFNSTTLDCTRKFKNFYFSGLAVQKVSDIICLEHGLSVIEPKPYRERQKRTEYPKRASLRDTIRADIDAAMQRKPKDFAELAAFLQEAGYEYKPGKQSAIRGAGQKRFTRFRSLGDGYSLDALDAVITSKKFTRNKSRGSQQRHDKKFDLLIDIQAKIIEGKGAGYARWAKVFNLKQMAQVMAFLQENDIHDFDELTARTDAAVTRFNDLGDSIKAAEKRLQEIAVLKTHIINYSKTREVYVEYRKSGYSKMFFEEHRESITIHKAAKDAFNALELKKLPRMKELNAEYAELLAKKKAEYPEYRKARAQMQEYLVAQKVAAVVLDKEQEFREQQEQKRNTTEQVDR